MAEKRPFRVFFGSHDTPPSLPKATARPAQASITLAELLETYAEATHAGRAWVHDFRHEEVTIPADLYEVITAYQQYRRSA